MAYDVVQESGIANGLIMSAQTGLGAGAYIARAEAACQVIEACEAGKAHVENVAGDELNTQPGGHNLASSTILNMGVGLGISIAVPALAPLVAKVGAAQFGVDAMKSMGSKSSSSEFGSFFDNDSENEGFALKSSEPSTTEMAKQAPVAAPAVMPDQYGGASFAENLDLGIKDRGADTIYDELDSGVTRKLAEGQLAFSLEQLSNKSLDFDDDFKSSFASGPAAPAFA